MVSTFFLRCYGQNLHSDNLFLYPTEQKVLFFSKTVQYCGLFINTPIFNLAMNFFYIQKRIAIQNAIYLSILPYLSTR